MKLIGKNIKKFRIEKKLTQKKLAEKLQISHKYLSDIETGRRVPSESLIKKINNFFELPKSDEIKKDTAEYIIFKTEILREINEKSKVLSDIEQQIKIKKSQYEKLERTTGVRSKITWLCIETQKKIAENMTEIIATYNLADCESQKLTIPALKQLVFHLKNIEENLIRLISNDTLEVK